MVLSSLDFPLQFADDCRTNGTAGRLRYVIEHFMTKELPHDAHLRCGDGVLRLASEVRGWGVAVGLCFLIKQNQFCVFKKL